MGLHNLRRGGTERARRASAASPTLAHVGTHEVLEIASFVRHVACSWGCMRFAFSLVVLLGCGGGTAATGVDAGSDGTAAPPVCTAFALETPAVACEGASSCPVVVAGRAPCQMGLALSVAPGAADRSYVAFTTNLGALHARLWTVDPAGGSGLESDMIAPADTLHVLSDASGTPSLLGIGGMGPLRYFPGKPGAWSGETITSQAAQRFTGVIAPDGTVHVVWAGDTPVHLARRTGPNAWTDTTLTDIFEGDFAIALDSMARTNVAYWKRRPDQSARDLLYAVDGATPTAIAHLPFGTFGGEHVQIALTATDLPVVAIDEVDGTHVVVPRVNPAVDVTVPGTGPVTPTGCPNFMGGGTPTPTCGPYTTGTCTETADGSLARAMVNAPDGTVWLAYVHRKVDRDAKISQTVSEAGYHCSTNVTLDRSATELVVGQVSLQGALDVRWRAPLGNLEAVELDLAARGDRLHVATAARGPQDASEVRLMVLDRAKL